MGGLAVERLGADDAVVDAPDAGLGVGCLEVALEVAAPRHIELGGEDFPHAVERGHATCLAFVAGGDVFPEAVGDVFQGVGDVFGVGLFAEYIAHCVEQLRQRGVAFEVAEVAWHYVADVACPEGHFVGVGIDFHLLGSALGGSGDADDRVADGAPPRPIDLACDFEAVGGFGLDAVGLEVDEDSALVAYGEVDGQPLCSRRGELHVDVGGDFYWEGLWCAFRFVFTGFLFEAAHHGDEDLLVVLLSDVEGFAFADHIF